MTAILENRQTRTFFTGAEVEHTVAYGAQTLFITGTPDREEIDNEISRLAKAGCQVEHLYFGTSQTFSTGLTSEEQLRFNKLITYYLWKTDYWVTLDFDVSQAEYVAAQNWNEMNTFIPMISVKLPNIRNFNYHATLKLDDVEWGYSNPGVWTHPLNELMSRNKYTDWSDYKGDK
jgi:hypothetical protein